MLILGFWCYFWYKDIIVCVLSIGWVIIVCVGVKALLNIHPFTQKRLIDCIVNSLSEASLTNTLIKTKGKRILLP